MMRTAGIRASRLAGLTLLAAGLQACTPSDCGTNDPAQAGLFSGMCNLATGAYDQRQAERRATLGGLEQEQAALAADAARLDARSRSLAAESAALEAQVSALQAQLTAQQQQLVAARTQRDVNQAELARLEAEQAGLRARLSQVQSLPSPPADEVQALQQQTQQMDAAILALLGDVRRE